MAQIIKRTCPDCGHVHTLNSNRFYQQKIEMICRNCGADFVFDHSAPVTSGRKNTKNNLRTEKSFNETASKLPGKRHQLHELEIKWNHVARIYWAWIWRTCLFSILFGIIFGLALGFAASMLNLIHIQPLFAAFGAIVGIIVGLFMMRRILKKRYRGFRLAIIGDP